MKYCKKCGAEIPEGVSFCEKCGNPVGEVPKQGSGKKKWVFAISSGVIILAVAVVGGLYVTGIIGGKDNVVQTSTDTADIQETPSVTEDGAADTEELEGDKQKDASDNGNTEDMAWEAYVAYKAYMDAKINAALEEYNADYEYGDDSYMDEDEYLKTSGYYYALVYVDKDNYPELVVNWKGAKSGVGLYTYKDSNVVETNITAASHIEYKECEGYVYDMFNESGTYAEYFGKMEDSYPYLTTLFTDDGDYISGIEDCPAKGAKQIEKELGIGIGTGTWNGIDYSDTIDEAYTQLLSKNKSKENN